MDWSEDWSNCESSPCAENVFPEQSQALALVSDDSSPEYVQQADVMAAEVNRTLAQARSAVASAKQNRSVFSSFQRTIPVAGAKARATSKENRKIHRVSSVARVIISGDSVLNDSRKDLPREVKMDLACFTWEPHGVSILSGAAETAGGVEAVQILVDALTQGFPDSRVEVDSLDSPWFRFANGHWAGLFQGSGCSLPWDGSAFTLWKQKNVPMNLLENHDISFRRNEFLVYAAVGHVRSVSNSESPVIGTAHRVVSLSREGG